MSSPVNGLCGRCLSVWISEPHINLPLYTQFCILVYSILIHTGKGGRGGGGVEPQKRGEGHHQLTKRGRQYQHQWLYLQSINSAKHLPQSPFAGQFFSVDDILLWCLYSQLVHALTFLINKKKRKIDLIHATNTLQRTSFRIDHKMKIYIKIALLYQRNKKM
jgi:hypothetical protein